MNVLVKTCNGITQVPMKSKFFDRRVITLDGEIMDESATEFADKVLELNLESTEAPITVLLNSPGGEVNSGLMIYDAVVGSRAPVRMVCRGKAYSMAAVLFASAKERLMLPNSELMLHQPLLGRQVSGNVSSIKSISDTLLETKERMNKLVAAHTGRTVEEIDKATSFDHYFNPYEAIEFGLCDRVVDFGEVIELVKDTEE